MRISIVLFILGWASCCPTDGKPNLICNEYFQPMKYPPVPEEPEKEYANGQVTPWKNLQMSFPEGPTIRLTTWLFQKRKPDPIAKYVAMLDQSRHKQVQQVFKVENTAIHEICMDACLQFCIPLGIGFLRIKVGDKASIQLPLVSSRRRRICRTLKLTKGIQQIQIHFYSKNQNQGALISGVSVIQGKWKSITQSQPKFDIIDV